MHNNITSITDPFRFNDLFKQYFSGGDVYLRLPNGPIKARFLGFTDGKAAFEIQQIKSVGDECVIYAQTREEVTYAFLKLYEQQDGGLFIFSPLRFQILSRSEERKTLESGSTKLVYVTNVISDFIIENSLAMSQKKTDSIRDVAVEELDNAFQFVRIFLCNEGRSDARMKYFQTERVPIYIPDFTAQTNSKDAKKINYYINEIYAKDTILKKNNGLVSEISVPFLHQSRLPYGYIQINSATPFMQATLAQLKKYSIRLDRLFATAGIFNSLSDKLIVSNISPSGFGIILGERKTIRYFKENSQVSLDMHLPGNTKASILANVKHIGTAKNNNLSVGFQITDMDALSEVNYTEFIDYLKKKGS